MPSDIEILAKQKSFIDIRIELAAETAFIEIKDNGIGIDDKYIDKIFDMFYRATQASQGSGIGLYIVREAVNKLKGIIVVQSKSGKELPSAWRFPNCKSKRNKWYLR